MNFRVSPQEKELIDARIALSGLARAEFFISSCLYQEILVKGNVKTFGDIKAKLDMIAGAIDTNCNLSELDPETRESLRIILEILNRIWRKSIRRRLEAYRRREEASRTQFRRGIQR